MIDKLIPDMYQQSIYTINYKKLKEDGIKCLLFDLDNTCVSYEDKEPNEKLKNLFDKLSDMGFKVIIYSNATKKRIEPFKKYLLVDCQAMARKPNRGNYKKVLKRFNFDISEVAMIGDQLFTDVLGGNKMGIKTILVNPVSKSDFIFTKLLRRIEDSVFKKLEKRGVIFRFTYCCSNTFKYRRNTKTGTRKHHIYRRIITRWKN